MTVDTLQKISIASTKQEGRSMAYQRTFKVFKERKLSDYLDGLKDYIQSEIERKSEKYILDINETDYIKYLVDEYTVTPLNIDFKKKQISGGEKQIPAEHFPRHFFVDEGKSHPRLSVIYHLPYSGCQALLECSPSGGPLWTTKMFLDNQCLCFEVVSLEENIEEIKGQSEKILNNLKTQFEYLITEVNRFNENLPTVIEQLFQERRQRFLDKNEKLAALDVPIKKREDLPETYTIPTPKFRKNVNVEPKVTEVGYEPEPTLAEPVYQDILQIIHDLGIGFERLPSTYLGKGEEDLRDYMLLFLGLHFEGSATGETFNKSGKTDILIRHEKSNAFIAECKFWKGKKVYLDAITQLLGYLTLRDSKAAVIVFVENKDFSSVIQTAEEVTSTHSNYLGFVDKKHDTWLNYRFHINGDKNREVKLGVLFFHIPEQDKS